MAAFGYERHQSTFFYGKALVAAYLCLIWDRLFCGDYHIFLAFGSN
jgi:hypothetical protein